MTVSSSPWKAETRRAVVVGKSRDREDCCLSSSSVGPAGGHRKNRLGVITLGLEMAIVINARTRCSSRRWGLVVTGG